MSSFAKNTFVTLISNIVIIIIGFLTSIITSKALGPTLKGELEIILLLPMLLIVFLNCGLEPATIYYSAKKKYDKTTIIGNTFLMIVVFTIASFLAGILGIFIFRNSFFSGINKNILYLAIFIAPLTFIFDTLTSILRGEHDFISYNKLNVLRKVILFIGTLVIILYKSVLYVTVLNIVSLFIVDIILIKAFDFNKKNINFSVNKPYLQDVYKFGLKCYLSNVITFFNYRLDTILIKIYLDNTQVGLYTLAISLVEQVWLLSNSVSSVIMPKIACMDDTEERNRLTSLTNRLVTIITFLGCVILYFISGWFIRVVFNGKYDGAIQSFKISLIGIFILGIAKILANDIAARGYPEVNTKASLVGLITNAILNVILIPIYGINGAAIATSVSYTIHSSIIVYNFIKISKCNLIDLFIINKKDIDMVKKIVCRKQ